MPIALHTQALEKSIAILAAALRFYAAAEDDGRIAIAALREAGVSETGPVAMSPEEEWEGTPV